MLTGIAWDHSRAYPPLVAAAQRHAEIDPSMRVRWEKRSLHEFGHMPIERLAARYDLIVIDHPFAGSAFSSGLVHDLARWLDASSLGDRFVGPSLDSYWIDGKLLAVPIDAATPCPSWRPDLLEHPPATMDEVLRMSRRVVMPGFGPDLFLNWLMLAHAFDGAPFTTRDQAATRPAGKAAVELLAALARPMPREIEQWNPIQIYELMCSRDDFCYCPFAYSYNNYCRQDFARRVLRFGNLVTLDGRRLRSILGGTGIAITRRCTDVAAAAKHAAICASDSIQRGVYAMAGGQPASRRAWEDATVNSVTGHFFRDTRLSTDEARVRPRYDGYVPFQEEAGAVLQSCVIRREIAVDSALDALDAAYRKSLPPGTGLPSM